MTCERLETTPQGLEARTGPDPRAVRPKGRLRVKDASNPQDPHTCGKATNDGSRYDSMTRRGVAGVLFSHAPLKTFVENYVQFSCSVCCWSCHRGKNDTALSAIMSRLGLNTQQVHTWLRVFTYYSRHISAEVSKEVHKRVMEQEQLLSHHSSHLRFGLRPDIATVQ